MKNEEHHTSKSKASSSEADEMPQQPLWSGSRTAWFAGIALILLAAYLAIVCVSYFSHVGHDQSLVQNRTIEYLTNTTTDKVHNAGGPLGAWLSETLISGWLGVSTFILIFYIASIGLALLRMKRIRFWSLTLKSLILAISLSMVLGLASYTVSSSIFWGGYHGYYMNKLLIGTTGMWGALIVDIILIVLTVLLFFNDLYNGWQRWLRQYRRRRDQLMEMRNRQAGERRQREREQAREQARAAAEAKRQRDAEQAKAAETTAPSVTETPATHSPEVGEPIVDTLPPAEGQDAPGDVEMTVTEASPIEEADDISTDIYDPTAELSHYRKPSLDILYMPEYKGGNVDIEEQNENKERIIQSLRMFGVEIARIDAVVGPTVTLYEIVPAEGVRIAQIKRLEADIALNLSAAGIRIIAPIPGRGTIGIEVPNKDPQVVPIRSILSSTAYVDSKMELPMAIGSTISNEVFIADLTKMPHLLVAGATGQGKSVGLNAIIASLLYKKHPAELKFVLVDPKMVEFSLYSKLERHFLARMADEEEAIITDPQKVVTTLNSLCVEMDNRYNLLKLAGDRNIKDYNRRFKSRRLNPEKGHRFMPYIVVIVDEFADLIMTAGKEVETPIARLAQKARAVGIHLILATQRPSTNVITGIIKANFPGRMAFRVSQMVDSRTILDRPGANQLIGRGDMLFSRDGEITRVQCALIETEEVEAICNAIDEQVGYPEPYLLPDFIPEAGDGMGGGAAGGNTFGERDPMFDECARAIVTSGLGSTSSLQRRFSIGYARAGKIMDQMEAAGIVGPSQGGKPRAVLVDIVTLESMLSSGV